jgi:chromosome segregation protein
MQDMERRFGEEFSMSVEEALPRRDDIEGKQLALDEIEVLKDKVGALGNVNVGAIQQHEQVKNASIFSAVRKPTLMRPGRSSKKSSPILMRARTTAFMTSFKAVQIAFDELFKRVFDGGSTELTLTHPDNLLGNGHRFESAAAGQGAQDISLLSGGERALTALSFMLALLRVNPSPFVVLDEVDAPLDQSNVGRFTQLLREFTDKTQFIVITHNNGTMQAAMFFMA